MHTALRRIIAEHGKLRVPVETLGDGSDLFAAGMDSLAVVDIMLAIEEQFGIQLPDSVLTRRSFSSITALGDALSTLVPA